jgi:hypothetical protein
MPSSKVRYAHLTTSDPQTTTRSTTTLGPGERKINPLFLKGLDSDVFVQDEPSVSTASSNVISPLLTTSRPQTYMRSTTTLGPGERKINPLFLKGLDSEVFVEDNNDDNNNNNRRKRSDDDEGSDVIVVRKFPPFKVETLSKFQNMLNDISSARFRLFLRGLDLCYVYYKT